MQVKIVSVSIENIKKGRSQYSKATVIYTYQGQARTQNIMSFANPEVFKTVQEWESNGPPTGEVDVEIGKNEGGFNEWRSINAGNANTSGSSTGTPSGSAPAGAPRGGTYTAPVRDFEGREERAARQVLIVKQSSLTAALKYLEQKGITDLTVEDVTDVAQGFTDWVFENGETENV